MSRRARQIDRRSLVNSSTTEAAARNMRASPRSAIVAAAMATTRPITVITARPPLLAAMAPTCRWNPLRTARPILVTEIPTCAVDSQWSKGFVRILFIYPQGRARPNRAQPADRRPDTRGVAPHLTAMPLHIRQAANVRLLRSAGCSLSVTADVREGFDGRCTG